MEGSALHSTSEGDNQILAAVRDGRLSSLDALRRLAASPVVDGAPGRHDRPGRTRAAMPSSPAPPPPPEVALAALDSLVGLETVKETAREIYAVHAVARLRRMNGLVVQPGALHMVFRGPPGTGKTTVARAFGQAFAAMGALERGHLVEVERADLVGEYVGHTAQRTRDAVTRALGGVLFIDEAYSLARGGEKDFGREAIDALVRQMEEQRERVVVVMAGYPREIDTLLATNPGLASRIPIHLDFPEYAMADLVAIARVMYAERGYALAPEASPRLPNLLVRAMAELGEGTGNARAVRNVVERSIRRHAVRVLAQGGLPDPGSLSVVRSDDIVRPRPHDAVRPDAR